MGILNSTEIAPRTEPLRTCASCGKKTPSSQSINLWMMCGSPGHPTLVGFQSEQEWACSLDCFSAMAHSMLDKAIIPHLENLHIRLDERTKNAG